MQLISRIQELYKQHFYLLLRTFVTLLFVDAIIDPNNSVLHLKYVLFVLVILIWGSGKLFDRIELPPKRLMYIILFISFFMPFYALSIGLINNFLQNTDLHPIVYFNSFFFFLLIFIIYDTGFDLTKVINRSTLLIIVITLGIYCFFLLQPATYLILTKYLVIDKNIAVFGFRRYGPITMLMIYFRTSPLLVFPLAYFLQRILIDKTRKARFIHYFILIAIIVTLFLSGTRANLVSLLFIILFYGCLWTFKKSKPAFILLTIVLSFLFIYEISTILTILFDKSEISNSVKLGHFESYLDYFSQNGLQLFFGQGFGGAFYSSGFNKLTTVTELTYLETVRVWGLPITFIFILILLLPFIKDIRHKNFSSVSIAYLAYLFIAGTNPFLFSSTGMMVLVYVFSRSFMVQNNENRIVESGIK